MGRVLTAILAREIQPDLRVEPIVECLLKESTEVQYGVRQFDLDAILGPFGTLRGYLNIMKYSPEDTFNTQQQWWTWPTLFDGPAPSNIPSWWLDSGSHDVSALMANTTFGRCILTKGK